MNELLNEIRNHPKTIKVEELPDEDFGFYLFVRVTYIVNETEKDADQMAICIIVDNREETNETAYYKQKPTYLKSTTFKDQVEAAAATYQQNHPEFEYYSIENVDEAQEFAIVRAYVFDSGSNISEAKRFIVFKEDTTLKIRELKTTAISGI